MWGKPTLLNLLKNYLENIMDYNYWFRKVNIDTINWEKLYGRSADHK